MSKTFNKGDTVYSLNGHQGIYVIEHDDGHIVMPRMREDDDYEPWTGEPEMWHDVYEKPPVPVVHEEVAAATAELIELQGALSKAQAELNTIRAERAECSRDHAAVRERLKQHKMLTRIDDWLQGNITHFVVWERYSDRIGVKTWEEVMLSDKEGRARSRDKLPLFVLRGTLEYSHDVARTNVEWCVVTDGDYARVIPFASEAEARAQAAEALAPRLAEWRKDGKVTQVSPDHYGWHTTEEKLHGDLIAIGASIPSDLASAYHSVLEQKKAAAVTVARKKVAAAEAELSAAEGGAA